MIKLKTAILFFFLFIASQQLFCQVYKFKTTSVSVSLKNEKGSWEKWSDAKDASLIVTLDTRKNRIVVYSEIIQLFEISDYLEEKSTDKEDNASFVCVDNNGEDCVLSIITRKDQGNRKQLYITYDDRIINYNIINFK